MIRSPAPCFVAALLLLPSCGAEWHKDDADAEVYSILERANERVLNRKSFDSIDRPVDTLRRRLLEKKSPVHLTLVEAMDVAAENSREFQRQKEQLYLAGLTLTQQDWNFRTHYSLGADAEIAGVSGENTTSSLGWNASASRRLTSGGQIVANFVNTFLRTLASGLDGRWDGASVLGMTFTQPLLRGFGERIVREPLTQAERNVIYQVRDFERFKSQLCVTISSSYLRIAQQADNLRNEEANWRSLIKSREQIEGLAEAGLRTAIDVGRARQDELSAQDRYVTAKARLESALDTFKQTLGLPTDAEVQIDTRELERVRARGVELLALEEAKAIELALSRRYDLQNVLGEVDDAHRKVYVAEDALRSKLDFSGAITIPTDQGEAYAFDFTKMRWSAGFSLELAVDKLPERNAYRSALITLDAAIRSREQLEDSIKADVREGLRSIMRTLQSYRIQTMALELAAKRADGLPDLYKAGRANALDLLDAQESLLVAQLSVTGALVDYAIARLELMRDLEAVQLEPKGLRFDPGLPLPTSPLPNALPPADTATGHKP